MYTLTIYCVPSHHTSWLQSEMKEYHVSSLSDKHGMRQPTTQHTVFGFCVREIALDIIFTDIWMHSDYNCTKYTNMVTSEKRMH